MATSRAFGLLPLTTSTIAGAVTSVTYTLRYSGIDAVLADRHADRVCFSANAGRRRGPGMLSGTQALRLSGPARVVAA